MKYNSFGKIYFNFLILIAIFNINLYSQNSETTQNNNTESDFVQKEIFSIKPMVGYNFNNYSSQFKQFKGLVDCNEFTNGSGNGLAFGLVFNKNINDFWGINFGINYSDRSGVFSRQNKFATRNLTTGLDEEVNTSVEIDTKLQFLDLTPGVNLELFDFFNGPLYFNPSLRLSIPVNGTFSQYEKIDNPSSAVFTNNDGSKTTKRVVADNSFETFSMPNLGLVLGLEKLFRVSEFNSISIAASYDLGLSNVLSDADWKINTFNISFGYKYSIRESKPEPIIIPEPTPEPVIEEVVEVIPPPPPAPPDFELVISNEVTSNEVTSGREVMATIPIVNSVFFVEGSSTIPKAYNQNLVNVDYFTGNAIEKHYYILPRIVKILNSNPSSKLIITGFSSNNIDINSTKQIVTERIDNIKNTLISMGVDKNIIKVEANYQPDIKSSIESIDLNADNNRVDLIVENAPLQNYVLILNYKEVIGSFKVKSKVYNSNEKVNIKTNISKKTYALQNDGNLEIIYKQRVDVNSNELNITVDANLDSKYKNYSELVKLENTKTNFVSLNLDNFEAVLRFDYNSSFLSNENKELLTQLYNTVPNGTTLIVKGSSDALGTEKRNKTLELERATNTMNFIKNLKGKNINIENDNNLDDKFDETTPQGRFLNRSIRIKLKP